MDSTNEPTTPAVSLEEALAWWSGLNDAWKNAFNEVTMRRLGTETLPEELLRTIFGSPAHRFVGPRAPYPNMSFELDDMSGLVGLPFAEIIAVTHQRLTHIREVASMTNLKSLFVYNNQIQSLEGIETRLDLKELYVQSNQVTSLLPLQHLVNLHTLYCSDNQLHNLEGIGEQHLDQLENFYCLPGINAPIVMRFEREVGIRCKKS